MTLALIHDPAPIAGPGSALMESFLRRSRAADLCDIIAGLNARMNDLHGLSRDFTPAEDAEYSDVQRDLDAAQAELRAIVLSRLGVAFERVEAAL